MLRSQHRSHNMELETRPIYISQTSVPDSEIIPEHETEIIESFLLKEELTSENESALNIFIGYVGKTVDQIRDEKINIFEILREIPASLKQSPGMPLPVGKSILKRSP